MVATKAIYLRKLEGFPDYHVFTISSMLDQAIMTGLSYWNAHIDMYTHILSKEKDRQILPLEMLFFFNCTKNALFMTNWH